MAAMFNNIATTYDIVNKVSSLGLDDYWRNKIIQRLKKTNAKQLLDIACGTGAVSWTIYRKLHLEVTGLDLSAQMLHQAEKKRERYAIPNRPTPLFIKGCAELLPFANQTFDAVTITFGVRNFENRAKAFQEIYRVLRPNGHLFILDFATPKNCLWKLFFHTYFWGILPLFGRIVSGDKNAYRYLPRSVVHFPQYQEFCAELSTAGFSMARSHSFTGGVAVLYTGIR